MKTFIGFDQALALTLSSVKHCGVETIPLSDAIGKYLSTDVLSEVDSPSLTTSRKDGFAVISSDIAAADQESPVQLELVGSLYAGSSLEGSRIQKGQTFQVTTGAPLPEAADAVISYEYCRRRGDQVICLNNAHPGRNILECGVDIARGDLVMTRGEKLSPPGIGLMAAAGQLEVSVYRNPRVAVIASGDEVVLPGTPLKAGQLYASNMMEIRSWLGVFGIDCRVEIVSDRQPDIEKVIRQHLDEADVFLTSGGAWGSERDLMLKVVETMGWQGIFHRVRMGPGKPVGFGLLADRPFFILPGGPPSNEMAFLQLALPALMKMSGAAPEVFPELQARLQADVSGAKRWTNFIHANLAYDGKEHTVTPVKLPSRLKSMARKNAIVVLPEGVSRLKKGMPVKTQILPA